MKKTIPLFFFCSLLAHFAAQAQDSIYYDAIWRTTQPQSAEYILAKTKTDSGWAVAIRYRSGAPEMTGRYADDSLKVQLGVFRWYNDKGVLYRECKFDKGKASGPETYYDDRGHLMLKGENADGERTGVWTGYFPSGKVAGTATYKAGKEASVALVNEDGTPNKSDKIFDREAEFPGGPKELLRFFNKNLKYPDYAVDHDIQGTVVVRFQVSKEGQVMNAKVVFTADKHLDPAALEVIRGMPEWKPAIIGGLPRETYKLQPVVFKLEEKKKGK